MTLIHELFEGWMNEHGYRYQCFLNSQWAQYKIYRTDENVHSRLVGEVSFYNNTATLVYYYCKSRPCCRWTLPDIRDPKFNVELLFEDLVMPLME